MGKKPVLGLVGACLASVTLTGCWDNIWDRNSKKDNPPITSSGTGRGFTDQRQAGAGGGRTDGWRDPPSGLGGGTGVGSFNAGGTGVGSAGAGAGLGGNPTGAGSPGLGGFNGGTRGPAGGFPDGGAVRSPGGMGTGGSGAVDPGPYPAGSSGAGMNGGRSPAPAGTSAGFNDTTSGGLPPMSPPSDAGPRAAIPGLPPVPAGPSPRLDEPPAGPGGKPALINPPMTRTDVGLPDMPTPAGPLPPPVPRVPSGFGSDKVGVELPPPPPPVPAGTVGLQKGPLPVSPAPVSIPTRPQAMTMPAGGTSE